MDETAGVLGAFLSETSLEEGAAPEVVLAVFAGITAVRTLTDGETLNVRMRPRIDRQPEGASQRLRLRWEFNGQEYEQVIDLGAPGQRELLQRLSRQPLLPLVISGADGDHLEVFDCENLFGTHEAEPPRMTIRMRRECRHAGFGHSARGSRC